jgi:hypothetical protein
MGYDPTIENSVCEIDQEVEEDQERAIDDHHSTQQEAVAVEDRVDEKTARSRDVENGFNDNRAGEKVCSQWAEIGNDRKYSDA